MVSDDEIDRRIKDKDAPRSERRSTAAKRIANLAESHAILSAQVSDVERDLGDALVDAQDVIDTNELHEITGIPTADLSRWLTAHTTAKSPRTRRKRPATPPSDADTGTGRGQVRTTAGHPGPPQTSPTTPPTQDPADVA